MVYTRRAGNTTEASMTREGGCQCGAVRYRVGVEPLHLAICHCTECQRQSGSAFGMSLFVPAEAFRLISGTLNSFTVKCDSGRTKTCTFCAACGTRIHHQTVPTALSLKAGTLDDTSSLVPKAHYWTKRKQPWVVIPDGVKTYADDG
jgi:hypothetical protein